MADSRPSNFKSCCRLCLCETLDTLKSVFDETAKDAFLPQKILQFVAIEINERDNFSKMVCCLCIAKMNEWETFKKACHENQHKLEEWMNSCLNGNDSVDIANTSFQIKEEPIGDTDDNVLSETRDTNPNVPNNSNPGIVPTHLDVSNSNSYIPDINPYVPGANPYLPEEVLVKSEPLDQTDEPMEEEYNELPPPLTPHPPDMMDTDNPEAVSTDSRQCSVCYKLFSSAGNRKKHEKQMHGKHQPTNLDAENSLNSIGIDGPSAETSDDSDQQKIQFAAGLKLLQKNATPISCEPLSKIELSYIEKCKAMCSMHKSLECACHNVQHPNLKGLLSHLRALRIWFPVFTCYNCMITFTDRSTFTKHTVKCPKTSLETINKLSNLKKRSEVKTRLYQNFKCTTCKFMYSFHEDYIKHVDEDHTPSDPSILCSCSRNFDNIEDYKDHAYVSCLVEYYCDICFITTKTLDAFQKHAENVHDNSEGFILLQDDNYKMRKPAQHQPKEVVDESVIVSGKRERRMSVKAPILETDDDEDLSPARLTHPLIIPSHTKVCPLCSKEYSSYQNMMRHYRTHTDFKPKPQPEIDDSFYSCPDCGGMYNTSEWQAHLLELHEAKSCEECGKFFQFQSELDQHRSVHLNLKVYRDSKTQSYKTTMISPGSEESEVMLMCEICDVMFTTKEDLKEHKLTHDSDHPALEYAFEEVDMDDKKNRYSCLPCNKVYSSYGGIWDHNKKKHPEKKTPFKEEWPKQCNLCDKVCTTGAAYHRHKMMHEKDRFSSDGASSPSPRFPIFKGKKPETGKEEEESYHTCKRCFKVFSSRYNLKNHMKSHGININPAHKKLAKRFTCERCDMCFSSNEALDQHQEEHSGDDMPQLTNQIDEGDSNKVPFIFTCDVCVMTFTTKFALKKHKEKHALETKPPTMAVASKQIYCKYCKIAFDSLLLLTKHMQTEHDETVKPKLSIKESTMPGTETPRQFTCNLCGKSFMTSSALSTHMGWHKRSPVADVNGKPVKVLKNNIVHKFVNNIKVKQEPTEATATFQCSTCLAQLPNDTALQVHILEKHRSVSAIMLIPRCNTCNKDFATQDEYETHKRLHDFLERQKQHEQQMLLQQQNTDSPADDSAAGQSTASTRGNSPAISDTKVIPQPKQSPSLPSQSKFVKSFPCKYCNAAFSRSDTLSGHVRQFHKEFVQQEFKCTQCERVFDKQNSLSIHLKVHEKQRSIVSTPPKPLFSCSICNMGFDLPKDLRAHTISAHPF